MKKIILLAVLFLSFTTYAQNFCSVPNPNFCPGNRFNNGNFEIVTGDPSAQNDQDINLATGWSPIWQTGSYADLFCQGTVNSAFSNIPNNSGNYASMWIINTLQNDATYREGMFNQLNSPILKNTGVYSFNFDVSKISTGTSSNTEIGIYGINYNTSNPLPLAPTGTHNPSNLNLFGASNSVLLGKVIIPNSSTSNWANKLITFTSHASNFPVSGITHILITKSDSIMPSWALMYLGFDNFCMAYKGVDTTVVTKSCDIKADFNYLGNNPVQFQSSISTNGSIILTSWDFGDGTTSTLANPLHVYNTPGSYKVCLSVMSVNGDKTCCDYICKEVVISENPYDTACKAEANFNIIRDGLSVTFNDNSIVNDYVTNYVWDFGDGTITQTTSPTINHIYAISGTYTVKLFIYVDGKNGKCCGMITKTIDVKKGLIDQIFENGNMNTLDIIEVIPTIINNSLVLKSNLMSQKVATVAIFDMSGRNVENIEIFEGEHTYKRDVTRLSEGTYIFKSALKNKTIKSGKFVINKNQ